MSLLSPWMLWLCAAAVVPPLLHLIGKRRARRVEFAALQFLLSSAPKRARAMRIERWVLTTIRVLVVLAFAFALAEPSIDWRVGSVSASDEPTTLVIIVDDSLSMSTRDQEGRSRFARAKEAASELISSMPLGSQVAVIRSARPAQPLHLHPTGNLAEAAQTVRRLRVRSADDDSEAALALAQRLRAEDGGLPSRVVVFSDLQRSGWAAATRLARDVEWSQIGARRDDVELVAVTASPAHREGADKTRVHAEVKRHGLTPWSGEIVLSYGDREVRSRLNVSAGQTAQHEFLISAESGPAKVSLTSSDGAPLNDFGHVILGGEEGMRLLIINGDPRAVARDDETFFVRRAVAASAVRVGELSVTVRGVDELESALQSPWDVVVLANVSEMSVVLQRKLIERVEGGMGLWITLGTQVPVPAEDWLSELLPARLADRALVPPKRAAVGLRASDNITKGSEALPTCGGGRVWGRWMLRPDARLSRWTMLSYSDGAPLWVLRPQGSGYVSLWTTSLDRDWNDLPLAPCYVPLMRQVALKTAGRVGAVGTSRVLVGQRAMVHRRVNSRSARLIAPDGTITPLTPRRQPPGVWRTPPLRQAGVYRVQTQSVEGDQGRLLISGPAPSESKPALLKPPPAGQGPDGSPRRAPQLPLWSVAFMGLFGLMVAEVWWSRSRRSGASAAVAGGGVLGSRGRD